MTRKSFAHTAIDETRRDDPHGRGRGTAPNETSPPGRGVLARLFRRHGVEGLAGLDRDPGAARPGTCGRSLADRACSSRARGAISRRSAWSSGRRTSSTCGPTRPTAEGVAVPFLRPSCASCRRSGPRAMGGDQRRPDLRRAAGGGGARGRSGLVDGAHGRRPVPRLRGQAVEPLVYGHSTGLSPFAVVVSALFWTWLWGPVGLSCQPR